ncbi:Protein Asterix [Liparis tanakae]|uniref:PAT complex subunit Asterix n=1 Tax=Liparis tanakae TaxID=230148 RepID=A0A4Z2F062_9TELE|nr:Protein Asterix [Liparis tanakae]
MSFNSLSDPRRVNKIIRYKAPSTDSNPTLEDPTPDYMNLLGMIFSMCGLMLKLRQLQKLRGHETDDEQLHAVHLGGGDVIPAEPSADVAAVVTRGEKGKIVDAELIGHAPFLLLPTNQGVTNGDGCNSRAIERRRVKRTLLQDGDVGL